MSEAQGPKEMTLPEKLRAHADAVLKMPVSEQFLGGRDVAFHSAMHDIATWIEQHDAKREREADHVEG